MKRLTTPLALALLALLLAGPALAAPRWEVDPPHCYLGFSVKHILAQVQGVFNRFDGDIRFDPDSLATSRVDVSIEVASLDTRNAQRNGHLLSPDFFEAAKYPQMRFISQRIESLGQGSFVAHGQLTIKQTTKAVDLHFTFLGRAASPMNSSQEVAGFSARLNLDRLEYGVGDGKFYRMGVVGKDVEVIIELELSRVK